MRRQERRVEQQAADAVGGQAGDGSDDVLVLTPDRTLAAIWSVLGMLATGLSAYAFGSGGQLVVVYGVLVLLCAGVTGVHLVQVLAPASWTLRLDRERLHGFVATVAVDVALADLRALALGRAMGDATLVLHGRDDRRTLLLPVGCDTDALRRRLAELDRDASRVSTRPPTTPPPPSVDGSA